MARYKIWDKKEDIYTLGVDKEGNAHFSASDYILKKAPWAAKDNVKVVVGGGAINGTVFMEFESMKDHYNKLGASWLYNATDDEILAAIEKFEDNPPNANIASPEERIAAALEFQNLNNLSDSTAKNDTLSGDLIKKNYDKGLWSENMVKLAQQKGIISQSQYNSILNT